MNRRDFLRSTIAASAASAPFAATAGGGNPAPLQPSGDVDSRGTWVKMLTKVAQPVLEHLARNTLKAKMPVETVKGVEKARAEVTHLEAFGRTLCGMAPWLGVQGADAEEEKARAHFASLARKSLENIVAPDAPDRIDFTAGAQNLVDAAFLALGLARGRAELWGKLDAVARERLIAALQSTRKFKPGRNNWLLFSATIEAFLASVGAEWRADAIDNAMRSHEEWYKGDGAYGDGPNFHWDYYNSFVIQPMLLAVLDLTAPMDKRWESLRPAIAKRARRFAAVQEMVIAPDGTYPPLGRSIAYRCGAFHHLAKMALRRELPESLSPAQVRCALAAVIHRTLAPPNTFDDSGWLRIGLAGHQPLLGEGYISTGSLYLCTFAFLPLGLPPGDDFWATPPKPWTSQKLWAGTDLPADHALKDSP